VTAPRPEIPKRVGLVVGPLAMIAFLAGVSISCPLVKSLCPYYFFGTNAVRSQNITITAYHRHYVAFSNGMSVTGMRLIPLDLIWAVLSAVFMWALFLLFLRMTAFVIRRHDPRLADDVLHPWRCGR
jgi:hypothetical protein